MVYCPTVFSSPSSASSLGDELQPRPLLRDSNANWCPNNRGFLPTGKDRKVTEKVQVWWTKVIVYIWNASFHHFGLINVYNKPGRVGITWVNLLRTLEAIQKKTNRRDTAPSTLILNIFELSNRWLSGLDGSWSCPSWDHQDVAELVLDAPQPLVEVPQLALRAPWGHVPGVDQDVGTRQVLSDSKQSPRKTCEKEY